MYYSMIFHSMLLPMLHLKPPRYKNKNKINNCDSYPKFRLKSLFYVLGASQ